MFSRNISFQFIVCVLLGVLTVGAQDSTTQVIQPQRVEVTAPDGLKLGGDYYALPSDTIPPSGTSAILLMHDAASLRTAWILLIQALLPAGIQVLSVDVRGHGLSNDKPFDAEVAVSDVPIWLEWLRAQSGVRPDQIMMGGAGLGAHLALVGCGNDPTCMMVFALSPGCVGAADALCPGIFAREQGLEAVSHLTANAVSDSLNDRPILLMAQLHSDYAENSVRNLAAIADSDLTLRLYKGGSYSLSGLFLHDQLKQFVMNWIGEHLPEG
jgi:pimeloyl-ACP methyl ester carboxylesterase